MLQTYLININIIEGKQFTWPNINASVVVKVDKEKKYTASKLCHGSPFYNEYFVFELATNEQDLKDKMICIQIVQSRSFLKRKRILGQIAMDIATVWNQPNHQFYHKWAALRPSSSATMIGCHGYLKIDISIISKGEVPTIPKVGKNDAIEDNLLTPAIGYDSGRQLAHFIFDVFYIHRYKISSPQLSSAFIEISFAGFKVKTTSKKGVDVLTWNERLVISEVFPPLCQRFKIVLKSNEGFKKVVRAVTYLYLSSISCEKQHVGCLPSFGPSFLFFYNKDGCIGKVLMGIITEIQDSLAKPIIQNAITNQPSLRTILPKDEEFLLFSTIFGIYDIDRSHLDKLSVSLSHDNTSQIIFHDIELYENYTTLKKPLPKRKHFHSYCYLGPEKPCLTIVSTLLDYRRRMYHLNLLQIFYNRLTAMVNELKSTPNSYHASGKVQRAKYEELLNQITDYLMINCNKYQDIASTYCTHDSTLLEKHRLKMCLEEMRDIARIAEKLPLYKYNRKKLLLLQDIINRLELLIKNEEDCWPNIYLWVMSGFKKIAYFSFNSRDLLYSTVEEETGQFCGKINKIELRSLKEHFKHRNKRKEPIKVDLFFWLGLERQKHACFSSLPSGFTLFSEDIPKTLTTEERHHFQLRAYIFQGRLKPGQDSTSLCDPSVLVTILDKCRETEVLSKTLNPVWNQSLVFECVTVFGSNDFIRDNPPIIFIDVFDKDACCKKQFVGQCDFRPKVEIVDEIDVQNRKPPKLLWHSIYRKQIINGEILAAFEFFEVPEDFTELNEDSKEKIVPIPEHIKPTIVAYRLEIYFWGIRNFQTNCIGSLSKIKVLAECGNATIESGAISTSKHNANFENAIACSEVNLALDESYMAPLQLTLYEIRSFGIYKLIGTHITRINEYIYIPMLAHKRVAKLEVKSASSIGSIFTINKTNSSDNTDEFNDLIKDKAIEEKQTWIRTLYTNFHGRKNEKSLEKSVNQITEKRIHNINVDVQNFDWWTKFYASLEDNSGQDSSDFPNQLKIKIYSSELELQPEFNHFEDMLKIFPIYKGKVDQTYDDEDSHNIGGYLKGNIRVYQWPQQMEGEYVTESGNLLEGGSFQNYPKNSPVPYTLRIYCIRAINLRPKDINGKSDPYLRLTINNKVINDRENYVSHDVNPNFGRYYECECMFPQDYMLTIAIYDRDTVTTTDDLIGETKIDVENRLFTKHRARCGLSSIYFGSGNYEWRDTIKPSQILENLCSKWNIPAPEYKASSIRLCYKEFQMDSKQYTGINIKENLALTALWRWQEIPVVGCYLVPEHVETRTLYNSKKPGIAQGKLQLWIDIFPHTDVPLPKPINISLQNPISYELRVIIWNTEEIKLQESDFLGAEKKSDIFVKGWLLDETEIQETDIHYRSLSGEGNFNWRFKFRFQYQCNENKMIVTKKEAFFSTAEYQYKLPCRLMVQVWDADTFSADDYLGALIFELYKVPRGHMSGKECKEAFVKKEKSPILNLFKIKRTRGWWPFKSIDTSRHEIYAGAVEIELELVTADEAERNPVGEGRDDPKGLPPPKRPDTSFAWFMNPFKSMKYFTKAYKGKMFKCIIVIGFLLLILLALYALPGYLVKKLLHA